MPFLSVSDIYKSMHVHFLSNKKKMFNIKIGIVYYLFKKKAYIKRMNSFYWILIEPIKLYVKKYSRVFL